MASRAVMLGGSGVQVAADARGRPLAWQHSSAGRQSAPELLAGQAGAFGKGPELGPLD
jgi:hypothetical protein